MTVGDVACIFLQRGLAVRLISTGVARLIVYFDGKEMLDDGLGILKQWGQDRVNMS